MLLSKCSIVSSVGDMYGGNPDGCVRISAMADRKYAAKACENIAFLV
jgi:bifunctional pyridoxal-dependent enzyme with beta-cystathionase and maltose regulon repressor activities